MEHNLVPGQATGNEIAQSGVSSSSTGGGEWIKLAKDAFSRSTTYFETNYRKAWEDGLRLFNSQHPRDSKYNSDTYKYRSRIFRPKTRSVIRRHEATAEMAFFSNPDALSVDPINEEDDNQIVSAQISKELLNYRLNGGPNGIPWFLTLLGAFQDTMSVGICASLQYWDYQTRPQMVKKKASFAGIPIEVEVEEDVPVVDKPCCELLPVQNIRFDPAAKWFDVVNTSPYLIIQLPMYLRDVLDRMEREYAKGEGKWRSLEEKVILEARITDNDPVQQARDGRREDPKLVTSTVNEFDVVMVHLNFIKTEEGCFTFYTLKDLHLLSEPIELQEAFLHGEIPVTVGFCVIETHKAVPSGLAQIGQQLQAEANEICNQRLDNVKFVLNKRWFVRRGANIDVESLLRNVPGGVSMMNDVEKDIKESNWTDVTASAFQEQDRVNADFDDLEGGGMNSSSVATNRRMNETVGGMRLMSQGANQLTEYTLKVFVESWVVPTLRQIMHLEQHYESDMTIIALAAQKAKLWEKVGRNPNLDKLLKQDLTLSINVGHGATDPEQRFQRFMQAMGAYTQIAAQAPPDSNLPEIRRQLFGLAGFKDSKRFFTSVDPRLVQAQKLMQQAESSAKQIVDSHKDRIQRRERQLDNREQELNLREQEATGDLELELERLSREFALKQQGQQFEHGLRMHKDTHEMSLAEHKAMHEAALADYQAKVKAAIDRFSAVQKARTQAAAAAATARKGNGSEDTVH